MRNNHEVDRLESLLKAYVSTEKKLNASRSVEAFGITINSTYVWKSLIHPDEYLESGEQEQQPSSSEPEILLAEQILALVKSKLPKELPMQGLSILIEGNKVQMCISAYSSLDELQKFLEQQTLTDHH